MPSLLPSDAPPLDPTSEEARRWLAEELRRAEYLDTPSLWGRFVRWLNDLLSGRSVEGQLPGGSVLRWLFVLFVVALVAAVGYAVWRSVRVEGRRGRERSGGVLDPGDTRTAAAHRAEAAAALGAGRFDEAVVAGFRAVARASTERTLLDDVPGRTAHEVAVALGPFFPAERAALAEASGAFDRVRYGHLPADEAAARQVVATDARVAASRPALEVLAPVGVAP